MRIDDLTVDLEVEEEGYATMTVFSDNYTDIAFNCRIDLKFDGKFNFVLDKWWSKSNDLDSELDIYVIPGEFYNLLKYNIKDLFELSKDKLGED